jgi:Domain of unknown function (DUF4145)
MKCPHCQQGIHESFVRGGAFVVFNSRQWTSYYQTCPECLEDIITLEALIISSQGNHPYVDKFIAYPQRSSSRPVPSEVPDPYKQDFNEAVAVLNLSPKASAALSRRNLQAILRDKAGANKKDLFNQIEEVIATGKLPSHISEGLHAVRQIGNIAAHSIKSVTTGEIVEVEIGEADWNLDIIESLFDFYFVQPAIVAKRKAEINKKLKDAGKPELT